MKRWAVLLLALAAASCAAPPPPPPAPPPVEAAAPPPPAAETSASGTGLSAWHGGEAVQLGLTRAHAVPPGDYGLYIYELPGDLVSQDMLAALEQFNCASLRQVSAAAAGQPTQALMLLPVTSTSTQPEQVDLALSHDFLRVTIRSENPRLIYIVITAKPIPDPQSSTQTAAPSIVITIPAHIAPPYVITWLSELRQDIEAGDIASPSAFALETSSLLYEIGGVGGIAHLWVQPAEAAVPATCS